MKVFLSAVLFFAFTPTVYCQWNSDIAVNNLIADSAAVYSFPTSVTDGANGSLIFFSRRFGLYVQKINSEGIIGWGTSTESILVDSSVVSEAYYAMTDSSGGAFLAWEGDNDNIYVQHLNNKGERLWGTRGIRVNDANTNKEGTGNLLMCTDAKAGIIVAWESYDTNNIRFLTQRFNNVGVGQWAPGGVELKSATNFFTLGGIPVPDGKGGAIFFLVDSRNDANGSSLDSILDSKFKNIDVYAQHVSNSGIKTWNSSGVAICTAQGIQGIGGSNNAYGVTDGKGGAIFIFNDGRKDSLINYNSTDLDIYAQRVDSNGIVQWPTNGIVVNNNARNQDIKYAISDKEGGFVAVWANDINSPSRMLQTQRFNSSGNSTWGNEAIKFSSNQNSNCWQILQDGEGNFIYVCSGYDSNYKYYIIADKLNSVGSYLWNDTGVIISNHVTYLGKNPMVLSGDGSAICTWLNTFRLPNFDEVTNVYAGKVLGEGLLAGENTSNYITVKNGNWNDPLTWVGGIIPPVGAHVIIKNSVLVNVDATCASLSVQPTGSITIITGHLLSIIH